MMRKSVLRSVRLDDDVWEAVKAMPCSLNQYLKVALLGGLVSAELVASPGFRKGVDEGAARARLYDTPRTRQEKKPLLKPSEKKKA